MARDVVEIDGADGGGSVVRLGVGLAAARGKPVRIVNIRGARKTPGLKAQHLAGVQAVAELCDAELDGAEVHSRELSFAPGSSWASHVDLAMPTAGSVGLALQPLQLAMLGADRSVSVTVRGGGTVTKWAPPLPYLAHVTHRVLAHWGQSIELWPERHGFFPKGGARVQSRIAPPTSTSPLALRRRGTLSRIEGVSMASAALREREVAERQAGAAEAELRESDPELPVYVAAEYADTASIGTGVVLWAPFERTVLGAAALGKKGKLAEHVGGEAARTLIDEIEAGATVDVHLADQLVPYLALYGGAFLCRTWTDHLEIATAVAERLTDAHFERTALGDGGQEVRSRTE